MNNTTEIPESDEVLHTLTRTLITLFGEAQSEDGEEEREKGELYVNTMTALAQTNLNRCFRVALALGRFFVRGLTYQNEGVKISKITVNVGEDEELWGQAVEIFLGDLAEDDFDGARNAFFYLASQQNDDDENSGIAKFINALVIMDYDLIRSYEIPLDF